MCVCVWRRGGGGREGGRRRRGGKGEIQGTYNVAAKAHKAYVQLVFHVSVLPPLQKLFWLIGEERLRDEPKEHLRGRLVSVWHESFVAVSFCKLAIIFQSDTDAVRLLIHW